MVAASPKARRSGEWIKGPGGPYKKIPQFNDILKVEADNASKYFNLPARYVFTAEKVVTAEGEMRQTLNEQQARVHVVLGDENDDRGRGH